MNKKLIDKISNSDQYTTCMQLYQEYILNLGQVVKENAVDCSSLAVSCLVDVLLKNGFFSIDHKDRYMVYKYDDYDALEDLFGPRVLTGCSVCRHKASFLLDVLNAIGFDSYRVWAYYSNVSLESLLKLDKSKIILPNHMVTGVIDVDGKYMYDITGSDVLFGMRRNKYVESYRKRIGYKIFPLEYEGIDILEIDDRFYDAFSKNFDTDYIDFIKNETLLFFKNHLSLFRDFYNENNACMEKIVSLYFSLLPYANERGIFKEEVGKVKKLLNKR